MRRTRYTLQAMPRHAHLLGTLRDLCMVTALLTIATEVGSAQVDPGAPLGGPEIDTPREIFASEERVTLIDVLVELPERVRIRLENGKTAQDVGLTAATGDIALPIVSVDAPPPGQGDWTQVIYLDAPLSAEGTIPWAAQLLAGHIDDLVALGPVEILLADPTPRRLLSSTTNPEELDEALAGVLFEDPGEGLLTNLREEVAEATETLEEEDRRAFEEAVAAEESRLLTERYDLLLGELLHHPANGRKAVYWVSSGFDEVQSQDSDAPSEFSLQSSVLAQTLAAYGWTAIPLLRPPPEPPLKPGKRIGKLRVTGFGGAKMGDPNEDKGPWIPVISMTYEEDREPERGRASYKLALALRTAGKLQDAEEALRAALRWFHGDPRTSQEQADCWEQLAEVLHELNRDEEARRAYEQVARLRPEAEHEPESVYQSRIQDPQTALDALAETTQGRVVRDPQALEGLLASLRARVVLSLQWAGTIDGTLLPLEISGPGESDPLYPRWLRRGTTERIAEARGRLTLEQDLEPPADLDELVIDFVESGPASIEVVLAWPLRDGVAAEDVTTKDAPIRRVSLATVDDTGGTRWIHRAIDSATRTATVHLPATPSDGLLIVVVEDLATGEWGARIVDIPG